MSAVRGVRGATTVAANERSAILAATRELLDEIVRANGIQPADVASATFTVTPELDAEFPAFAAREIGWTEVPLICGREIPVAGALGLCVRVLIHWNTDRAQGDIRHAFLHGARTLRPRWAVDLPGDPPLDAREVERHAKDYERAQRGPGSAGPSESTSDRAERGGAGQPGGARLDERDEREKEAR